MPLARRIAQSVSYAQEPEYFGMHKTWDKLSDLPIRVRIQLSQVSYAQEPDCFGMHKTPDKLSDLLVRLHCSQISTVTLCFSRSENASILDKKSTSFAMECSLLIDLMMHIKF